MRGKWIMNINVKKKREKRHFRLTWWRQKRHYWLCLTKDERGRFSFLVLLQWRQHRICDSYARPSYTPWKICQSKLGLRSLLNWMVNMLAPKYRYNEIQVGSRRVRSDSILFNIQFSIEYSHVWPYNGAFFIIRLMQALYSCVDGAAVLYSFLSLIRLPPLGKIFSKYEGNSHCYADDAFLYLTMQLFAIGV